MPDLSNVNFLERGLNWSTLAYVIFVCLAAATSFLLALFAARVTSAKNDELQRVQSNSAEAVAHSQAGAARAQAQAAQAYTEQRRLEADLVHAKVHHEKLRQENLELELAVEKERIARMRLEESVGGRHITEGQRQSISRALSSLKGQNISIITYAGDAESAAFAGEIKAALESAGIAVTMAPALMYGKPQAGISLEMGANSRQAATALAKAFVDAGVASGPITAGEADDAASLEITVGPKP